MTGMSGLMAAIAAASGGGGSGHYTSARKLMRFVYASGSIGINDGGAVDLLTTANGWTSVSYFGTALDSNFVADTWKTVANLTGPGLFYGAIGPTASNNADITSMRFTRDGGSAVTIAMTNTASANRAMILAAKPMRSDAFTSASNPVTLWGTYASVDSNATRYPFDWGAQILPQDEAEGRGARMVEFETSLLVEMKITNAQSTTTNQERQAGVLWRKY